MIFDVDEILCFTAPGGVCCGPPAPPIFLPVQPWLILNACCPTVSGPFNAAGKVSECGPVAWLDAPGGPRRIARRRRHVDPLWRIWPNSNAAALPGRELRRRAPLAQAEAAT